MERMPEKEAKHSIGKPITETSLSKKPHCLRSVLKLGVGLFRRALGLRNPRRDISLTLRGLCLGVCAVLGILVCRVLRLGVGCFGHAMGLRDLRRDIRHTLRRLCLR